MSVTVKGSYDKWGFRHVKIADHGDAYENPSLSLEESSFDEDFEFVSTAFACPDQAASAISLQQAKPTAHSSWSLGNMWQQASSQGIYEEVIP